MFEIILIFCRTKQCIKQIDDYEQLTGLLSSNFSLYVGIHKPGNLSLKRKIGVTQSLFLISNYIIYFFCLSAPVLYEKIAPEIGYILRLCRLKEYACH